MTLEIKPWELTVAAVAAAYWLGHRISFGRAWRRLQRSLTPAQRGVVSLWIEENSQNGKAR